MNINAILKAQACNNLPPEVCFDTQLANSAPDELEGSQMKMKRSIIYGVGHINEILYSRRHPRGNPAIKLFKSRDDAIRMRGERLNVEIGAFNGTDSDVIKNQVCRAMHEASIDRIAFSRVVS